MDTRAIVEVGGLGPDGVLHQLPTRGVTGPRWDGSVQAWTVDPSHYDAVHFHTDDLYDAGWPTTATVDLPTDLPSGIYAFRMRAPHGEDRIPFFVRPALGAPTADVALLMPSCTYMAYANHRQLIDGADFISARTRLRPEHEYVRNHPEVGRSHYEEHARRQRRDVQLAASAGAQPAPGRRRLELHARHRPRRLPDPHRHRP